MGLRGENSVRCIKMPLKMHPNVSAPELKSGSLTHPYRYHFSTLAEVTWQPQQLMFRCKTWEKVKPSQHRWQPEVEEILQTFPPQAEVCVRWRELIGSGFMGTAYQIGPSD